MPPSTRQWPRRPTARTGAPASPRWAWTYHDALRRHPWVLRVPISGPPVTPNQIAWLEDGLRSLAGTGLAEGEKLSVILLVSGYVRNEGTLTADLETARPPDQQTMPMWARQLHRLTDPEHFPALHAALASDAVNQDDDPDEEFVFGLERVLDGIEVLIRARHPRAPGLRPGRPGSVAAWLRSPCGSTARSTASTSTCGPRCSTCCASTSG